MHPTPDELIARLRSNPEDRAAFSSLKAFYQREGDQESLIRLLEGWAARQRDREAASDAYFETANLVLHYLGDRARAIALCERAIERNPAHREAATFVERALEEDGNTQRLVEVMERRAAAFNSMRIAPREAAKVHQKLGKLWEQLAQTDRAISHYRRAFELDPGRVAAIYAARQLYRATGKLEAAVSLYDMEVNAETDPTRKIALLRELAHLRVEELSDLEGAVMALKRALTFSQGDLGVLHDMAMALTRRAEGRAGDAAAEDRRRAADLFYQLAQQVPPEHALTYVGRALDVVPDHDGAMEMLERLAEEQRRPELLPMRWIACLRTAPDAPGAEQRRTKLGKAYIDAGQPEDAAVCLEPLLERGDPVAADLLVPVYRALGRSADVPKALSVAVSTLPPKERVPRLRELIELLVAEDLREEAVARARELLELDPADAEAIGFLEDDYMRRGEFAELRELMLTAARIPGLSVDLRKHRLREVASLSERKLSDSEGAIGAWRAVLALDPADADARDALAALLEKSGRWDDLVQVLDRDALAQTEPDAKVELYRRLATIHREKREDPQQAIAALRMLVELRPMDERARADLSDILLEVGAYAEAVPLLRDRVDTTTDVDERVTLLRALGDVLETKVGDDEGAFRLASSILDDLPMDETSLERMERIDRKNERYDRLLETLSYRVEVASPRDQPGLLKQMGDIADRRLSDLDAGAAYYVRALELAPRDADVLDALCDIYDRAERYRDLVELLRERAMREETSAVRAEFYRRIARTLAARVRNDGGAAEAWREVLAVQEDEEALRFLRDYSARTEQVEDLAELLDRLASVVEAKVERCVLRMEQAELLAGRLGRLEEAVEVLYRVVTELDPSHAVAVQRLVELCDVVGDEPGLADALERQLALTDHDGTCAGIASRLVDLYEGPLGDRVRAIDALFAWIAVEPMEPNPRRRLIAHLEQAERWQELMDALDALVPLEESDEARSRLVRHAAEIAATRLSDVDGAWARLVSRVELGDPEAETELRSLALDENRSPQLAEFYVRLAQGAADPDEQKRRWVDASRVYEEHAHDVGSALEAMLRAFALDLGDEELMGEVDRLATAAEAWTRLTQVYDSLVRQTGDNQVRARLLLRVSHLLDERAGMPSDALDRVLRVCALCPDDDEVLARAEALAARSGRAEELLIVYDRRRTAAGTVGQRVDASLRAAKLAEAAEKDRERALESIAAAVWDAAEDPAWLETIEEVVRAFDQARPQPGKTTAKKALVDIYLRLGEKREQGAAYGSALMLRAAQFHARDLKDKKGALSILKRAALLAPENGDVLDRLETLAAELGALDSLEQHLGRMVDEALSAEVAKGLLRRRGVLLEERLGRYEEAADAYRQLATIAPDDEEAPRRLRNCLRETGRFEDVLIALDRALAKAKGDDAQCLPLLREVAVTWERDIGNRWEAADAWRAVLSVDPGDESALEAVERLGQSTRRLSPSELAGARPRSAPPRAAPKTVPGGDEQGAVVSRDATEIDARVADETEEVVLPGAREAGAAGASEAGGATTETALNEAMTMDDEPSDVFHEPSESVDDPERHDRKAPSSEVIQLDSVLMEEVRLDELSTDEVEPLSEREADEVLSRPAQPPPGSGRSSVPPPPPPRRSSGPPPPPPPRRSSGPPPPPPRRSSGPPPPPGSRQKK